MIKKKFFFSVFLAKFLGHFIATGNKKQNNLNLFIYRSFESFFVKERNSFLESFFSKQTRKLKTENLIFKLN